MVTGVQTCALPIFQDFKSAGRDAERSEVCSIRTHPRHNRGSRFVVRGSNTEYRIPNTIVVVRSSNIEYRISNIEYEAARSCLFDFLG